MNVDPSQIKVVHQGLFLILIEATLDLQWEKVRMKNFYFLLAAGCMVLSQAHADTVYQYAQSKRQAEGHYLSAFWKKAQTNHAFVNAFSDPKTTLVMGKSSSVHIVNSVANTSSDKNQTFATSHDSQIIIQSHQ